jgi:molybdopterin/thiamine biosynthesis adenylyltransferase
MDLDRDQMDLYSRQMLVDEIGFDGQLFILATPVHVFGPDPWRGWATQYLAAAGFSVSQTPHEHVKVLIGDAASWEVTNLPQRGEGLRDLGLGLSKLLAEWMRQVKGGDIRNANSLGPGE